MDGSTLRLAGDDAEDEVQVDDPQGVKRLLDKVKNNPPWYVANSEQFRHVIQITHKILSRIQELIRGSVNKKSPRPCKVIRRGLINTQLMNLCCYSFI